MYTVYLDNNLIYDLNKGEDLVLIDPELDLELNSPGTFTCTMPLNHPFYDEPKAMLSRVQVFSDGEEIFTGRIIDISVDFYKQKTLTCEGELGFLNDSIQRPAEYHEMSVRGYLETLIENHNAQVEEDKQFEVGYVLVTDTNDSLYRYTNYNSTMTEIKEDLVDDLGGYIRVRNHLGHRYIDYIDIDDYGEKNDQIIRFGENLLDYTNDMDTSDIATVIIPLGEKLDESPIEALDMRLTIESVNDGSDAIESEEAVKTYGRVVKTVVWDDVTLPENLLSKGKAYLSDYQWDNMVLEVGAVDLHFTDSDIEQFHLGDQIRVISDPHGLDRWFPLAQITIPLSAPDQWSLTLGIDYTPHTLTAKVATTEDSITKVEEDTTPIQKILDQAAQQATNLITAATHGYVVVEPDEILIMDNKDKDNSNTHLWRWNMGGLGFSKNGYNGDYGENVAITMDGSIDASFINTGTLNADIIRAGKIEDCDGKNYWNLNEGESALVIGGDKFALDKDGNLSINTNQFTLTDDKATFSGTLSAVTGTFTSIYTGSHSSYNSTNDGFYAGTDGMSIGKNFKVSNSGILSASSVDLSGTISAGSGSTLGGWYIGAHKIYSYYGSKESSSKQFTGIQDPNNGTYAIAVNATASDDWSTATFRVKHDGSMYASSGEVGGWTIGNNKLYAGSTSGKCSGIQSPSNGTWAISIGAKSHSTYSSGAFRVKHTGEMVATAATLSGEFTCGTGDYSVSMGSTGTAVFSAKSGNASGITTCVHVWAGQMDVMNRSETKYYFYTNGAGTWAKSLYYDNLYQSSDKRLKRDLGRLENAESLEILRGIDPVKYSYKDESDQMIKYGFFAQDVRDLLISSGIGYRSILGISKKTDGGKYGEQTTDIYQKEEEVQYAIDYEQLIPILISGWKYHEEIIQRLMSEEEKTI